MAALFGTTWREDVSRTSDGRSSTRWREEPRVAASSLLGLPTGSGWLRVAPIGTNARERLERVVVALPAQRIAPRRLALPSASRAESRGSRRMVPNAHKTQNVPPCSLCSRRVTRTGVGAGWAATTRRTSTRAHGGAGSGYRRIGWCTCGNTGRSRRGMRSTTRAGIGGVPRSSTSRRCRRASTRGGRRLVGVKIDSVELLECHGPIGDELRVDHLCRVLSGATSTGPLDLRRSRLVE